MAASILPCHKSEEFKERFLTCPICYESYDNGEHQAKCLPCLHTFCLSCLQSHAGKRLKFNCPQCRKEIILPGGNVDSLPNNFLVENLKEYQDLLNLTISCGSCDEESQAVNFCHDCRCFLCYICVDNHTKMRPLRHHKRSTMQELQQQKYHPRKEQLCEKHPTQTLNLYCKEATCKIPVCASCGLVDHRGHELVDLTAAVDEIVAEIKQFSAKVNGRNQELAKRRSTIETQQKLLNQNLEQKLKEVCKLERRLIKCIKSRCNEATTHIIKLRGTENKRLATEIESIDNLKDQMTNASEFANKACDMNHLTQLLTSQHQITDRLTELKNADLPETTSGKTEFTFTDNHQSALAQIQESVQYLCDVTWLQCTGLGVDQKGYLVEASRLKNRQHGVSANSASAENKPRIDPTKCTIKMGLTGQNSWWRKAVIQAVDTNGKRMTTGSAKVEAKHEDGIRDMWQVRDNKDGTYTFEYNTFIIKFHVKINGTPMRGSPFTTNE